MTFENNTNLHIVEVNEFITYYLELYCNNGLVMS